MEDPKDQLPLAFDGCSLVFEMEEDDRDFPFGFLVDLEIGFGPELSMTVEEVLPHHDERHEHDLDHIGDEQPQDEGRARIEPVGPRG